MKPMTSTLHRGFQLSALPSDFDFDDDYELFVGTCQPMTAGAGDVYRVLSSIAYDLDVAAIGSNDGIISLDLVGPIGDTYLAAGQYDDDGDSPNVYYSDDDGDSWSAY